MALKAVVKLAVESGHSPEFYSYLRDERIYDETSVGKLTRVSTSGCIRMCVCACVWRVDVPGFYHHVFVANFSSRTTVLPVKIILNT